MPEFQRVRRAAGVIRCKLDAVITWAANHRASYRLIAVNPVTHQYVFRYPRKIGEPDQYGIIGCSCDTDLEAARVLTLEEMEDETGGESMPWHFLMQRDEHPTIPTLKAAARIALNRNPRTTAV